MKTLERQFSRTIGSMNELLQFIEDFIAPLHMLDDERYLLIFVGEELFTNVVKYNSSGPLNVTVILIEDNGKFSLVMEDETKQPFDLTVLKPVDVDVPLEKRKPGGLGIHLMRSMMDEVTYTFDKGISRTTVVKYLEKKHV